MAGLGGERSSDLRLTIHDGEAATAQTKIHDSAALATGNLVTNPLFTATRQVEIGNRPWTLKIHSGAAFERQIDNGKSEFIAVAGTGTGLLLALLVWALATGRRRALTLATKMTSELRASEYRWKYALEGAGDGVWDRNLATSGTTFRIYLPRSLEHESPLPAIATASLDGGTETILVVEDDPEVQAAVVEMLTDLGYRTLQADNADSALGIVNSGVPIDMLFTDVVMPGALRGPELAQRVQLILPDIAVLFTSGCTQDALMSSSRLDPAVNLLGKPYRRDQLAAKIRSVLSKKYKKCF